MGIKKDKHLLPTATELRRHAEEQLRAKTVELHAPLTAEETQRLVHELEVHQIELEMQNEELRQAQEELELSRNKYVELYDFAPGGYFTFDSQGLIREVNLTGAQLLGIERGLLAGKPFTTFIADADGRDIFSRHLETVLQRQGAQRCEIRLKRKDGLEIHGQLQSVIVDTSESPDGYILSSIVDGTAGKQLETEIQEAREYAESIIETMRRPLMVLDSDLKILSANPSYYFTFMATPEETIGNFIYDLGNRQWDIPGLRVLLKESLRKNTGFNSFEVVHDFPTIGRKIILLNARRISRKNIGSHTILLAMEDITARRQLETEIQHAREYAENIVEAVREPLVVLNSYLKILTANHSFYETFKVTPEATIGNFIYDVGNRQWDIPKLRVLFEEILPMDTVFNGYEVEHDFPGIGRKIILLNARQIFRENIGSHIILLAMEDITERKQLGEQLQKAHDKLERIVCQRTKELSRANVQQQELAESNLRLSEVSRIKSDFLANMSHELRTPLNSVIGFSEVLLDQLFGPINDKQQEYVNNILSSGRHLLSLINDILDLSKVESGKMELELTGFSLRETLNASLMMLREKALKDRIVIHMNLLPQADLGIVADQRKLKQIMFNLLSNAVKFTPVGGAVDVSASRDGDFIEITVADTGMGIRNEDIPKLFQTFTQLESAYTKEYEGTGLGLALTRQLVELHGGRIWVKSEFGTGSRFSFTIPLTQAAAIVSQPARPETVPGKGTTVLLIEDEKLTLAAMGNMLQGKGYQVLRAKRVS